MQFILDLFFNDDFSGTFLLLSGENSFYVTILKVLSPFFEVLSLIPLPLILVFFYLAVVLWSYFKNIKTYDLLDFSSKNPLVMAFIVWFTATAVLDSSSINVVKVKPLLSSSAANTQEVEIVDQIDYVPMAVAGPLTLINKYVYGINYSTEPLVGVGDSYLRYETTTDNHDFHLGSFIDGDASQAFQPRSVSVDNKEIIRRFTANLSLETALQSAVDEQFISADLEALVLAITAEAQYYKSLLGASNHKDTLNGFVKPVGVDGFDPGTFEEAYVKYFKGHPLNTELFSSACLESIDEIDDIISIEGDNCEGGFFSDLAKNAWSATGKWASDSDNEFYGAGLMAGNSRVLLRKLKKGSFLQGDIYVPTHDWLEEKTPEEKKTVCDMVSDQQWTQDAWKAEKLDIKKPLNPFEFKSIADNYKNACKDVVGFDSSLDGALTTKITDFKTKITALNTTIKKYESDNGLKYEPRALDNKEEFAQGLWKAMFDLSTSSVAPVSTVIPFVSTATPVIPSDFTTIADPVKKTIMNTLLLHPLTGLYNNDKGEMDVSKNNKSSFYSGYENYTQSVSHALPNASIVGLLAPQVEDKKLSYLSNIANVGIDHMVYSNALSGMAKDDLKGTLALAISTTKAEPSDTELLYKKIVGMKFDTEAKRLSKAIAYLDGELSGSSDTPPYIVEKQKLQLAILQFKRRVLSLKNAYSSAEPEDKTSALALYLMDRDALSLRYLLALGYGDKDGAPLGTPRGYFTSSKEGRSLPWMTTLSPQTARLAAYIAGENAPHESKIHFQLNTLSLNEKKTILTYFKKDFEEATIEERFDAFKDIILEKSNMVEYLSGDTIIPTVTPSSIVPSFVNALSGFEILKSIKRYANDIQIALIDFIGTGSFPTLDSINDVDPSFSSYENLTPSGVNREAHISYLSTVQNPQKTMFHGPGTVLSEVLLVDVYTKQHVYSDLMPMFGVVNTAGSSFLKNSQDPAIKSFNESMGLYTPNDRRVLEHKIRDKFAVVSDNIASSWASRTLQYPNVTMPYFDKYLKTEAGADVIDEGVTDLGITVATNVLGGVAFKTVQGVTWTYRAAKAGLKAGWVATKTATVVGATKIRGVVGKMTSKWRSKSKPDAKLKATSKKPNSLTMSAIAKFTGGVYGVGKMILSGAKKAFLAVVKYTLYAFFAVQFAIFAFAFYVVIRFLRFFFSQKILPLAFYFASATSIVLGELFKTVSPSRAISLSVSEIFDSVIEKGVGSSMKKVFLLSFEVVFITVAFSSLFLYIDSSLVSVLTKTGLEAGYVHIYETALSLGIITTVGFLILFYKVVGPVVNQSFDLGSEVSQTRRNLGI